MRVATWATLLVAAAAFSALRSSDVSDGQAFVTRIILDLLQRPDTSVRRVVTYDGDAVTEPSTSCTPLRDAAGWSHVQLLLRLLHARQNPPTEDCKQTRLLLVRSPAISYEGLGSTLSLLTLGLAEAFYSNRTLIWGADITPLLELPRALWAAPNATVRGVPLDCSHSDKGGGAYSCIFEPLSTCSLADVTPEELAAVGGGRGFSNSGRVKIMDHRHSFVAYSAPPVAAAVAAAAAGRQGELGYSDSDSPALRWPRHLWYGALATYVARVQPRLQAEFERTRASLGNGVGWPPDTACMHVRHGDVYNLPKVYTNRDAFEFPDYFNALLRREGEPLPQLLTEEHPGGFYDIPLPPAHPPQAVFIASDSPSVEDAMRVERAAHAERQRAAACGGSSNDHLMPFTAVDRRLPPPLPPLLAIPPSHGRFMTDYGSHTIAAGYGICMQGRCGLPLETMQRYDAEIDANGPSRAPRLLGVIYDAAEDLYLLSKCTRMALAGTSRYGAIATALSWARSGGSSIPATVMLDVDAIERGELQSGWLHWTMPDMARGVPGEQWRNFTRMFVEGLWPDDPPRTQQEPPASASAPPVWLAATLPPARMLESRGLLPFVPPELLWPEALRWSGALDRDAAALDTRAQQVWPGECPLPVAPGMHPIAAINAHIEAGARHLAEDHLEQALACWAEILRLADEDVVAALGQREQARAIATRNIQAVLSGDFYPYAGAASDLAALVRANVPKTRRAKQWGA